MMMFGINVSWLLLGILAVLSIYWLWTKTRRPYTKFNIPPYPVKPWPLVGHSFMILRNTRNKLKEWNENPGDIYSLDIAGQHHIVVNNFKAIKEIWVRKADYIINTAPSFGYEVLGELNAGIVAARDNNWKEQRSTVLSILRSFGVGKNIMADKIQEEVSVFVEKLANFKGRPEDISSLVDISVSNVICSVIVGKRFEHEDPYFVHMMHSLHLVMKYYFHMMIITPLKSLNRLPGDILHAKKYVKASIDLNESFVKFYIRKFKQEFNESEEPNNFISAYLQEMKKKNDKGVATYLSERDLITGIKELFLAGTDTTSTTILWCLLYMLYYPEIQEKVYKEIEKHVGTERVPNISDKPNLTYLNAVIMETQRMASIVVIGLRREISATFEAFGYTFPQGSIVWSVLDSVHFDKKIWGDPENFRPERFIDENGVLINREELIPFSIGKRVCLGEALAKMELFLFLSAMFQRFRFELPDKSSELPTLEGIFGTVVLPQKFKLRFVERKH